MFFRKKQTVVKNNDDEKYIKKIPYQVDVCIAAAKDENIKAELAAFRSKVEYLSVSPKSEVLDIDEKLSNKLTDLYAHLEKKPNDFDSFKDLLGDCEVLLAKRECAYH